MNNSTYKKIDYIPIKIITGILMWQLKKAAIFEMPPFNLTWKVLFHFESSFVLSALCFKS